MDVKIWIVHAFVIYNKKQELCYVLWVKWEYFYILK
jgi:hypothetical protein